MSYIYLQKNVVKINPIRFIHSRDYLKTELSLKALYFNELAHFYTYIYLTTRTILYIRGGGGQDCHCGGRIVTGKILSAGRFVTGVDLSRYTGHKDFGWGAGEL